MPRVKIKTPSPSPQKRGDLLRILATNQIYATRIIELQDGYVVLTLNDEEVDKIFQEGCKKKLEDESFTPLLPPELRAKRTVLIFNVDNQVYSHSEEEIQEEFTTRNQWLKDGINSVYKFPRNNIIKISFNQTNTAKKALEKGILGFYMNIPAYNIKQEEFVNINTCLRCYVIEQHPTNQCHKDANYKICSECGEEGHTWRECTSTVKKCLNCNGPHRTLANKCPERKKILNEKLKVQRENKSTTYSQAASSNTATQNIIITPGQINKCLDGDAGKKILGILIHSHLVNLGKPGSFNKETNQLLKLNNLPTIILPDNPDSAAILNSGGGTAVEEILKEKDSEIKTSKIVNQSQEVEVIKPRHQQQNNNTSQEEEEEVEVEMPQLEKITGSNIGLQIITKSSVGWPQDTVLSLRRLREGFENDIYKWCYTDNSFLEESIFKCIINNEVDFDNCWALMEDNRFSKIRNGFIEEKTPPPSKVLKNRHRHSSK